MSNNDFIFGVNTLAGCKYSILKDLVRRFPVEKKFRKIFRTTKLVSAITTCLSYPDELIYRNKSRNFEISKPPIFVLGHWRSGTTFLNNLLCCYKNISYPTTYQSVFPNNLFFLQSLMKRIVQYYLPSKRLVDNVEMHVDFNQEEEFALGNEAYFSFYYWFYFPKEYHIITQEYLEISPMDTMKSEKFKQDYIKFVKRCLLNVGGDQYIAKNPPNMARIPVLLELFPEARFAYIERNPYEVLISTYRFYKGFLETLQLQEISDDELWNFIYQTYRLLYTKYSEDKQLIPEENLIELKYENLVHDTENVFLDMHKKMFSEMEIDDKNLESNVLNNKNHEVNEYKFGKKYIDRVNLELGSLIKKQGYSIL